MENNNQSWPKDMSGYMPETVQKDSTVKAPTQKSVKTISKTDDELLELIKTAKSEFNKRYEEKPNPQIYNAIINLESINI